MFDTGTSTGEIAGHSKAGNLIHTGVLLTPSIIVHQFRLDSSPAPIPGSNSSRRFTNHLSLRYPSSIVRSGSLYGSI